MQRVRGKDRTRSCPFPCPSPRPSASRTVDTSPLSYSLSRQICDTCRAEEAVHYMLLAVCLQAIGRINPSVAQKDVKRHEEWLKVYGSI